MTNSNVIRWSLVVAFGVVGTATSPAVYIPHQLDSQLPLIYFALEFSLVAFVVLWGFDLYKWIVALVIAPKTATQG